MRSFLDPRVQKVIQEDEEWKAEQSSFEHIWEKDAQWLMGRQILSDILKHLEGKSLRCVFDDYGSATIGVPFPTVKDEISGTMVPIYYMIPQELLGVFLERHDRIILRYYQPYVNHIINASLGQRQTPLFLAEINAKLMQLEQDTFARTECTLSDNAAEQFGMGGKYWRSMNVAERQ